MRLVREHPGEYLRRYANTSGGIQGAAKQAAPKECAARQSLHQPVGTENWNE
jgi:hypothetical protein